MTIGIIGLGAMGLGIAQVYAQAGHEVLATDANAEARGSAAARLARSLDARVAKGAMTAETRDAVLGHLRVADRIEDLAPADLVIEAVVERLDVKQAVFAALEGLLSPDAVLATNTSSLSVGAIAAGLSRPDRLLGLHFFNPAPAMRLVELIPHPTTAPDALAKARSLTEAAGKTVIQCADRPGFIVNRCARPYYGEALALLSEGRSAAEIDAAMVAAGFPVGPFGLIDLIGADINLAATESLAAAMGDHPRYHVFPALKAQVASGNLGRKTGRGFVFPDPLPPAPSDAAAITLRIEAVLVNEAAWLLAEGGTTAEAIDTALRLGLNFPRGPFAMLAQHGRDAVQTTLAALETAAPPGLKGRYLPAPDLRP
ncbi:3-hydroxyacyl-CoA dehydrogenase NAD-binding domain-containing protein [Tabrizicola sp.]|uniref:3-hydroxyacyl-CoA dehydrogenase n=1 Tax=Tabrizicola sp. TaxID=2005166 RepID=UPI0026230F03|nr:3-hydroxyacyl-CoA dehydrogenase NAD-binding domain-containing protein [Tabrizicola sp.]MDM7932187.1 3-hydroxyacyl-CoA dehydrogenase NAD-binding domain-containing protein [Tabrizicola sp.]